MKQNRVVEKVASPPMHELLVQETSFQENNVCCLELRQLRHPADVLRQGIQPRRGRCILLGAGIEQVSCRYHTPQDVQCRDDLEAVLMPSDGENPIFHSQRLQLVVTHLLLSHSAIEVWLIITELNKRRNNQAFRCQRLRHLFAPCYRDYEQ